MYTCYATTTKSTRNPPPKKKKIYIYIYLFTEPRNMSVINFHKHVS